jgi:peptidoglycan hydrolase CwlO-like protein
VVEGQFAGSSSGTDPLVVVGDTYVAKFTYDTETTCSSTSDPTFFPFRGAVVSGYVKFQRGGETYFTGSYDTASPTNSLYLWSGYLASPSTDDALFYLPYTGVSSGGTTVTGVIRCRLSDALGSFVPEDGTIPSSFPETGTWTAICDVAGQSIPNVVDSATRQPKYVAWTYEAPITSVHSETPVGSVTQVGDVVCGTIVFATDRVPTGSHPETFATYRTSILLHEIVITRDGVPVWAASQSMNTSYVTLETAPAAPNNQIFRVNTNLLPVGMTDTTDSYYSWMIFYDRDGSDMLADTSIPTGAPENWETAYAMIAVNGNTNVFAPVSRSRLETMDVGGDEYYLGNLDKCLTTVYDLKSEVSDLDSQISSLNSQVSTLQQSLTTANDDIAAKQAEIDTLTAKRDTLQEQVDELVGTGYAAWKFEADVTSVAGGYGLDDTIQVGDTLSGSLIMHTDVADDDPDTSHALYLNPVLDGETAVAHAGETVWQSSHTGTMSRVSQYVSPEQRIFYYDEQREDGAGDDSTVYTVTIIFTDRDGNDMLASESLPTTPPANWEEALVQIRIGGITVVTATMRPASPLHLSLADHLAKRQELESRIADLEQQVADLTGTGYVAWKFSAEINWIDAAMVENGVQVGDTVSGYRVMRTDVPNEYGDGDDVLMSRFLNPVVMSETQVTRDGQVIWQSSHSTRGSQVQQNLSVPGRQTLYCYDYQDVLGNEAGTPPDMVVVDFIDTAGEDMLASAAMLTTTPANWETGYVHLRTYYGMNWARASLLIENVHPLSQADHVTRELAQQAESTDLRTEIAALLGTGYSAWNYEATVTEVVSGSPLDGTIQVGDALSGFRVMANDLPDQDSAAGHALYANPVVMAETKVSRGGTLVWGTSHTDGPSRSSLYPDDMGTGRQMAFLYDDETETGGQADAATYTFVLIFEDAEGNDMLADESMPTAPFASWTSAYVEIRSGMTAIARAELQPTSPAYMSLTDHLDLAEELSTRIAVLEQRIAEMQVEGFVAWKYAATVTYVESGSPLAAAIQVGDTVSGSRLMKTDLPYESFDGNHVVYNNPVLTSQTVVTRDGASVWEANHVAGTASRVSQYFTYYTGEQVAFFYDDELADDSSSYTVAVIFVDQDGNDMLVDENMLTSAPRNWERAVVYINLAGATLVRAELLPEDLADVGLSGGEAYLEQLAACSEEVATLTAQVDSLTQEVSSLEADKATLEQDLASANSTIATQLGTINTLMTELAAANADIADKQAQIDTLVAEKAALQQQLDAANADIAAKQAQIDTLTAELATANADIAAKQAQIDTLTAELDAANTDIAAKQAQIDTLDAEKAALQQQLDAANADIAAKQAQIDTLTAELDAANADIAAKQAQIDTLTAELDAANADIAAKQAQIDTLTAELDAANADIVAKQAQIDTLVAEKADLQQQLDTANARIEALEENVAELEAANAGLTTQVESVEDSLSALQSALADEFNDPDFTIPGDTPEAQAESLKAAILSLNHGHRQALFRALGGNKNGR